MPFKNIALFGATGQIGNSILRALLSWEKNTYRILAFIPPGQDLQQKDNKNFEIRVVDLDSVRREQLASALAGIEVVISALNGKALDSQALIQDAAADAGVIRFYPSEYGMHHVYRKPGDAWGYIHPMWNMKAKCNEQVLHHPAVDSGKMTYTLIGCGDFYNQDREKVWCPWTQPNVDHYDFHIIGDPNAKVDFTHLDDLANYLVQTLAASEISKNACLNFVSDQISYNEISKLLESYSKRKVNMRIMPEEEMHRVVSKPDTAPKELQGQSAFPVDFWFLVKGIQGQGRFHRSKGEIHNALFPEVQPTTFESYFRQRFGDQF